MTDLDLSGLAPAEEKQWQRLVSRHGMPTIARLLRIHGPGPAELHVARPGLWIASKDTPARKTTTAWEPDIGVVHNGLSRIKRQGKGLGTKMFAHQVLAARKVGVEEIQIGAAEKGGTWNGHYTWPRLGFDAPVPQWHTVSEIFPQHKFFHHLMKDPGAREWWREHGDTLRNLVFRTHPDSPHSEALVRYMREKGIKV